MHPKRFLRRIIHPSHYPWGGVLMFHRIDTINPQRLWYNEHLKISPDFFEHFYKTARQKHFSFVCLDELLEIIKQKKRTRRIIAITLDDGYKDNYTNGLPLFKTFNIPFCIYVATRFPEKSMTFWWYLIEDIILQQEQITLSNGKKFLCRTKEEKESAFLSIREEVLKLPCQNFDNNFSSLLNGHTPKLTAYNEQIPLTWDMISQLAKEPLATIGCHTHSHLSMSGCSREMIIDDINISHRLMQMKAGIQMRHFAYPFGDDIAVNEIHKKIVEELHYKTIATTNEGFVFYNTNPLRLPRIFVTEKNAFDILDNMYYAC